MAYIVEFGTQKISDYCTVLNVGRSLLPSRSNFSKQIPSMNGSYYTGHKYNEKIIKLEVAIFAKDKKDYINKVSKLADLLNVKRPTRLVINDEPYKIYYVVPNGTTDISKQHNNGTIEIELICNDPIAESLYWESFAPNSKGIFNVFSYGTANTYPIVEAEFLSSGCFFQLTNFKGQTVLVGKPRNLTVPTEIPTNVIIQENCKNSANFSSISEGLLDQDRKITGQYGVGFNGNGIVCTNFGTSQDGKWTGTGFRRNLNVNVSDFEVEVELAFSSQGENYVEPAPTPPPPAPAPTPTPPEKPPIPVTPPPPVSLGTWKVVNCGGLWINGTADVSQPLYPMAPGTLIYPVESSGNWFKHTHSNAWNTFTGWSSKKYLQKVSDSGKYSIGRQVDMLETEYADEEIGTIEVYGFGQNGEKLFKFEISDVNEFFEYVDPATYIGNTKVLDDNKSVPTPRTQVIKDDKGNIKETNLLPSGVFGDFNDFTGKFIIKRETNSTGQQIWSCEIRKIKNGITERVLSRGGLSNSGYPKADLNYLGIYVGRYGSKRPVDTMAITSINVNRLNFKTDQAPSGNVELFKAGDKVQVDFENCLVKINDIPRLSAVDIGSEFFAIPPGNSQFLYKSDARTIVSCAFKDRFI